MGASAAEREAGAKRARARKEPRILAQEGRRQQNLRDLGDAYNPRATMTQMRWRHAFEGKNRVLKLVAVQVSLPPSKQLNRAIYAGSR